MRRALIVVNPAAGRGRPLAAAAAAAASLERAGWKTRTVPTASAGHATDIVRAAAGEMNLLVVAGGDGTLREAVVGLDGSSTPVGLIPLGNANVMARELRIPRSVETAAAVLASGRPATIDAGRVNGVLFLAMIGVGFDGRVTRGVGRLRATSLGAWLYRHSSRTAYGLAALPALLQVRGPRLRLSVDGREQPGDLASVIVSNAETYALGWAMTPGADIRDGRLDHLANRRSAPWFVAATQLAAIAHRRLPSAIATYGSGRHYRITSDRDFHWQMDGDPMLPAGSLDIETLPAHLRMLVPAISD